MQKPIGFVGAKGVCVRDHAPVADPLELLDQPGIHARLLCRLPAISMHQQTDVRCSPCVREERSLQKSTAPRIVIAPDSFKGSVTAAEVASAVAGGLSRVWPDAQPTLLPLSDGGEGWVDTIVTAAGGRLQTESVTGPLGDPVEATYGLIDAPEGPAAVIEMASASDLHLIDRSSADPRRTTTYGTGELIVHALDRGVRRLLVGIGGSATNDGGAGLAQALGVGPPAAGGAGP